MDDDVPFLEPEDEDESDDEAEADKDPVGICRHCGSPDCHGYCYFNIGENTP